MSPENFRGPFRTREAVLLAGGLGTRLRAVIGSRPKALVEVGGRPFLFRLLDALAAHGIERVILALGHGADQIRSSLERWPARLEIEASVESRPLGTGGAMRLAAGTVRGASFFGLNADSVARFDFPGLDAALTRSGLAAIQLAHVPDAARFGTVAFDADHLLLGFREKTGNPAPGWISAGVYALEREAFLAHTPDGPFSIEQDYFAKAAPRSIAVLPVEGEFIDIGTEESLARSAGVVERVLGGPRPRGLAVLDRDGTIVVERNYLGRPEEVEILPGAAEGIRRMRELGLRVVVVTNQSGVARGYFTLDDVQRIHARIQELLGGLIDAFYVCPHHPDDDCACRKPKSELLVRACAEAGVEVSRAVLIGDKACDVEMGRNAGARTILVRTGYGADLAAQGYDAADEIADDLSEAAERVACYLG